jgi:hypothetical protein
LSHGRLQIEVAVSGSNYTRADIRIRDRSKVALTAEVGRECRTICEDVVAVRVDPGCYIERRARANGDEWT